MTYAPNLGDIGLVRIKGAVGKGIRFAQWLNGDGFADYEHAFTYVGAGQIVEAEPGGARRASLSQYADRLVVWLRCPSPYGFAVADAAWTLIGTPYSFLDYQALAMHRFHIPAPGLRRFIANSGHMICSQLCDHAAMVGGWHIFDDGRWEGYVTPGDLYREYRKQAA
jgi:hypothetical protein